MENYLISTYAVAFPGELESSDHEYTRRNLCNHHYLKPCIFLYTTSKQKLYCCYRIWHRFCDTEVLHWHKIQNLFMFLSLFMFFGFCCSQCCCKYQKIKRRNNSALKIIWMFLISIFITVGYLGVAWMSVRQDSI